MNDTSREYQIRARGSGKTVELLDRIKKFRDKERANAGKTYPPVVTKAELEFLKAGNPSMADWWDANAVVIEVMEQNPTLLERLNNRHGSIEKEAPTPNRADRRRRLRNSRS